MIDLLVGTVIGAVGMFVWGATRKPKMPTLPANGGPKTINAGEHYTAQQMLERQRREDAERRSYGK